MPHKARQHKALLFGYRCEQRQDLCSKGPGPGFRAPNPCHPTRRQPRFLTGQQRISMGMVDRCRSLAVKTVL
eukprot:1147287-Pelagomonas_calceolata.AAC.13